MAVEGRQKCGLNPNPRNGETMNRMPVTTIPDTRGSGYLSPGATDRAVGAVVATPVHSPSQHFRGALVAAVRIGDDTDTVAAIAGGLLGARWGLAAIPDEWTRHLHGDRVRGETLTGAEFATVALQAFDCTMRRFCLVRAARHGGAWPEVLTPETIRHGKALEEWTRQCEESGIFDQ